MFGKTKSKRFIRIMVHEEEFLTDIDTNECVGSRYCTFSLPIEIKTDLTKDRFNKCAWIQKRINGVS